MTTKNNFYYNNNNNAYVALVIFILNFLYVPCLLFVLLFQKI